jgi:hypothetical protein
MELLPGESALSGVVEGLSLTSHRVRYDRRVTGGTQVIGITLDAVSSCGLASKTYPILLLLAVLAVGFGVLEISQESRDQAVGLLLLGVALVVAYSLTRTVVLAISSAGQSIVVAAKGINPDSLVAFVDDVEQAKLKYLDKIA